MKIAILYICTGKYDVFWKEFYESSEKHFFKNDQKDYYVFTDSKDLYKKEDKNVHVIYQENLGWPGNTLFRFKMFTRILNDLKKSDYIFFLNANALFLEDVDKEILPDNKKGLIVVKHPGFYNKERKEFTYDNNKKSLSYIGPDEGEIYVCGGFNGGSRDEYIKLIKDLTKNIDLDYEKGIIALWHDESHLNKYILDKKCKVLPSTYMTQEANEETSNPKVIVRDKNKYGGHNNLRGIKESKIRKFLSKTKKTLKRILKKIWK